MRRLRLGALLHFIIAIGHVGCLFALDKAFEAYGIREIMNQMAAIYLISHSCHYCLVLLAGSYENF